MNRSPEKKDAKAIFSAAVEYYMPEQWEAYIVDACGDDEALRQRVRELLDAHRKSDSFFDRKDGMTEGPPISERAGTTIGPYKLLQEIGEGGFGVVYMAEQQKPVRRKVALKIIKPGMDTKQVVARFEAERQALALMDHPNIAKVLDAGSTESGRPYFVMELVKGVPVTTYCDKNNLNTGERLSLFTQICRAVQHAHQKGVIHRDLKPSNVMVTLHDGEPVPKVIDFGVSKAISQQLTEKTLFTAYGQMIGTPQYMSPEQAEMSGLDVDTRSDVYSLGVLLYELLTGTTPLDSDRLRTLAYGEMQRVIREEEPPRPSARISTMGGELTVLAKNRSTDAKHLTQTLRGDLDWIVMKALAKERGRRYETPSSLAADIERHLADEPTEARPPSTVYQLRRFARRNKGPVAAAAAVMLVLLLGIAGTTSGLITATNAKRHAQREAIRARSAEEAARAAESDARTNLERSEELSGQLSASVAKLSENASRLAAQRAQTLIEQDRRTEGLHWLGRALELASEGDSPLTTEIRTTMSVVANQLPSPRFVIPCAAEEVFAQTTLSPDGSRILQLIRADPPAEPRALEARLLDAATGQLVTSMAVSPETTWVGFSADSRGVYSFDGERLQRWSDKTGVAIGPGIDLSRYRVGENASPIAEDRLESMPPEFRERFQALLLTRTMGIRGITAGGEAILFSKARPALAGPLVEGSRGAARGSGGRVVGSSLYLLDLETDTETLLPGPPSSQLSPGGELVVMQILNRRGSADQQQTRGLHAWDVAAGELREDWQVDLDVQGRSRIEVGQHGRNVLISQSEPPTSANPGSTIYLADATAPERAIKTLEIEGVVPDLALSPSGQWAAILATTADARSRVIVWDLASGQSRIVPLQMQRNASRFPGSFGPTNYKIGIAADDKTLLIWDDEQLIGWQLASASQPPQALPTAGRVLQLRQVGREWITVSSSSATGQFGQGRSGGSSILSRVGSPIEIQRWDADSGQPIGGVITIMADLATISTDGHTMATAHGDQIHRWSLETMSKIGPPIDCTSRVVRMEFVAEGSQIAAQLAATAQTGAGQKPVRITYQRVGVRATPAPSGTGLLIDLLVPGSAAEKADLRVNDIVLRVGEQEVSTGAEFRQQVDLDSGEGLTLTVLRDGVEKSIQLRPDPWPEDELRVELDNTDIGRLQVWDARSGQPVGRLPIPREGTVSRGTNPAQGNARLWSAVATDGRTAVTASLFSSRTELRLFSVATGRPIRVSVEHRRPLRWLGFGPQGRLLATRDSSSTIQLWDAENLTPVGPRIQPDSTASAVSFAPDGESLIVCGRAVDGPRLSQWDTTTSQRLGPSIPAPNVTALMRSSPDGQWLAAAGLTHSAWLLPLPKPWTGDAERMRQLVEATTGTTMSESGDIDLLDGHRWKSLLEQLPEANTSSRRFAANSASPWAFDSSRPLGGFRGTRGLAGRPGSDEEMEQGLKDLDESLIDSPQSAPLRLRRVEFLLALGQMEDADAEFESLLTLVDRQNLMAWLKRHAGSGQGTLRGFTLGGAFGGIGGPRGARGRGGPPAGAADQETSRWCLEKILQLDPSDASGLLQMIVVQIQSGKTDEAKAIFARAMKHDGRNLILQSLQSIAAQAKLIAAAFESFLRNRSIDDEQRVAALEARIEQLKASREAAKQLIDWIITEQPDAWELLMIRAEGALLEQRFDDAAADLKQVAALATKQQYERALRVMANRTTSLASRSRTESTSNLEGLSPRIPIWETILDVFPDNVYALTQLKYTQGRLADWEQAAAWLQRLAQTTPEEHWPQYQLAPVLLKLGRVDEYQKLCRGMLQQFDESSKPRHERLAIQACLWRADVVDDPQRLVDRMQAIFDGESSPLYFRQTTMGMAYLRSGNATDAIEWLEKPLEPDSSVIPTCEIRALAALSIAYHKSGDEAKAKEVYELATERFAEEAPEAGVEDLGSAWHDWLICDLLLEEAKLQLDRSAK